MLARLDTVAVSLTVKRVRALSVSTWTPPHTLLQLLLLLQAKHARAGLMASFSLSPSSMVWFDFMEKRSSAPLAEAGA